MSGSHALVKELKGSGLDKRGLHDSDCKRECSRRLASTRKLASAHVECIEGHRRMGFRLGGGKRGA